MDATLECYNRSIRDCLDAISCENEKLVDHQAGLVVYLKNQLERSREINRSDQVAINQLRKQLTDEREEKKQ